MKTVKATREGIIGGITRTGYIVDRVVPFVALPSATALNKFIRIRNPLNNKYCLAVVLDIGPWNGGGATIFGKLVSTDDNTYVFGDARPQAESGVDKRGRKTNGAGIDLSEKVWLELGMTDNTLVDWEFVDPESTWGMVTKKET